MQLSAPPIFVPFFTSAQIIFFYPQAGLQPGLHQLKDTAPRSHQSLKQTPVTKHQVPQQSPNTKAEATSTAREAKERNGREDLLKAARSRTSPPTTTREAQESVNNDSFPNLSPVPQKEHTGCHGCLRQLHPPGTTTERPKTTPQVLFFCFLFFVRLLFYGVDKKYILELTK